MSDEGFENSGAKMDRAHNSAAFGRGVRSLGCSKWTICRVSTTPDLSDEGSKSRVLKAKHTTCFHNPRKRRFGSIC